MPVFNNFLVVPAIASQVSASHLMDLLNAVAGCPPANALRRSMRWLAETCEAIAGTTKKLLKTGIVAYYLKSRTVDEAAVSAVFLSGRPFPAWEDTTLQVGGRLLWRVVAELAGKDESELTAAYRKHGDLGAVAG